MQFNYEGSFFRATDEMNTYEKHINAPYIRRCFDLANVESAKIIIGSTGFYDLWLNSRKITKGLLAPYISNPDDIVYFDEYDITSLINKGENCVGIILGNGMQNSVGGRVWDFDIARFRGVPSFAFELICTYADGSKKHFYADESWKCAPSPIIFDDERSGCFYDANLEQKGWSGVSFDDSRWCFVKKAENPRGEYRLCEADPIKVYEEKEPVRVYEGRLSKNFDNRENMRLDTQFKFNKLGEKGIVFDFGVNAAGTVRLKIKGEKGQKIFIQFCEQMTSKGEPSCENTGSFYPEGYGQTAYYVLKGDGEEIFEPAFCYYGFRYAVVFGLNEEQVKSETLTYLIASSSFGDRASCCCSSEMMNTLIKMAAVSDRANFYYFPTDCPHREKNGWTGDAAASAEHMLLTMKAEKSYTEWLRNICKAQNDAGALPGIIPTGGWGMAWGNGPAWDNVLTELCWQIYRFTGDLTPAKECRESIFRYLSYVSQRRREDGLIAIGLGDWLQPLRGAGDPVCPLYVTDSLMVMYIAEKSQKLFEALGLALHAAFAKGLYDSMREAIRKNLVDFDTMTVLPRCQTSQAASIYYGVFNEDEKERAYKVLVDIVNESDCHLDCGLLGIRTVFHILSDCGRGDMAFKMITREDFPSFGMMVKRGLTSIAESFISDEEWAKDRVDSLNHHFFCDYVSWFIQRVVGIRVNPHNDAPLHIDITPDFLEELDFAQANYETAAGEVYVKWERAEDGMITLTIKTPYEIEGDIILPDDYQTAICSVSKESGAMCRIFKLSKLK